MATKKDSKSQHGGKRAGAGRKPRGKAAATTVGVRLSPSELAALEAARKEGEPRSVAARRLMMSALGIPPAEEAGGD